jgi:hypothetical protein
MKKLAEILTELEQGKISSNHAEKQVLDLFAVITSASMTVMTDWIGCPEKIPFQMLSERQAQSNHNQTLKRLNERGGMSAFELVANIERKGLGEMQKEHDLYDKSYWATKLKKYLKLYESGEF